MRYALGFERTTLGRCIFTCFTAACSLRLQFSAIEPARLFDRLAGSRANNDNNARTEETWTSMDGGPKLGTNRNLRDGRTVDREFLSVETDDAKAATR